jgi:hypothetical protein
MFIFIFFTTLYGLAHLYFFFSVTRLTTFGSIADAITGTVTILLALSPVFVHIGSFRLPEKIVKGLAAVSYTWTPFIIIFFPAAVALELYNLAAVPDIFVSISHLPVIPQSYLFAISVSVASILVIYGYFEARMLVVEHVRIETNRLPPERKKIRILQIADLHIGLSTRRDDIISLMNIVRDAAPDIIVSTGDLVDGVVRGTGHYAHILREMSAELGKFAVLGNHEYYGGIRQSVKFISDAGFRLLRGGVVNISDMIYIAGVDDIMNSKRSDGDDNIRSERELLDSLTEGLFTILLKHRADVDAESCGRFDLQLSGHTHKGQMFPVNLVTMWIFKHHAGLFRLPEGSMLYVSRGAGTAGPPVRLLSRPEITVIDIVQRDLYEGTEGGGHGYKDQRKKYPVSC